MYPATIDIPAAVPVFACRVIRGVRSGGESPTWLRERLRHVGINSISPIVDVTNYVMTELGQPLHAYDLERLTGSITVRYARAGERAVLLDDKEYALDADHVVIADASGVVGLGAIMGGRGTAISDTTTTVLFEAAHFTPDAIAGRARRLGLFTDAAQRFERGVDPSLPVAALERATALLLEIAGGEPGPVQVTRGDATVRGPGGEGGGEQASAQAADIWVTLRRARLSRLLGVEVPDAEVAALLGPEGWRVRKPPHRFDVRIEADLIEEVARLRGFDSIAEAPAIAPQIAGLDYDAAFGDTGPEQRFDSRRDVAACSLQPDRATAAEQRDSLRFLDQARRIGGHVVAFEPRQRDVRAALIEAREVGHRLPDGRHALRTTHRPRYLRPVRRCRSRRRARRRAAGRRAASPRPRGRRR